MPGIRGMMTALKCGPGKCDRELSDIYADQQDIARREPRAPNYVLILIDKLAIWTIKLLRG